MGAGFLRFACGLTILFFSSGFAFAEDCSDVLRSGTMSSLQVTDRSIYEQYNYQHFITAHTKSSDTSHGGSVTVPIYDVPVTFQYSETDAEKASDSLNATLKAEWRASKDTDLLLLSGDSKILAAWAGCITSNGGGLVGHFEKSANTHGTEVILKLQYFLSTVQESSPFARITRTVLLRPYAHIIDGADCLKRGHIIRPGIDCNTTIKLDHATDTLDLIIASDIKNIVVSLPARIHHVITKPTPLNFNLSDKEVSLYQADTSLQTPMTLKRPFTLTKQQIDDGWLIVANPISIEITHPHNDNSSGGGLCYGAHISATPTSVDYGYYYRNFSDQGAIYCEVVPKVTEFRDYWVPDDQDD